MLNKLQIIGHIGQDASIYNFSDGNIVASFNVATTEPAVTTSKGQNIPERTTWHRINVFGKLAQAVSGSLRKGTKVYCEGPLIMKERADKQTGEVYRNLEMDCKYLEFLSPKRENQPQTDIPAPTIPPKENANRNSEK